METSVSAILSDSGITPDLAHRLCTARELLARHRDARVEPRLPTAAPALDRLLAGGLRRGAMIELVGRRSSGRFSLILSALAAATGAGEAAALVDLGDGLDPEAAVRAGVVLERLLWARPRRLKEALASAEAILASGMPLVVLDLGLPPIVGGRGVEAFWLRLARAARSHEAALLVSSPYRLSGTSAAAVIELQARRARWQGGGGAPHLLTGIAAHLELAKGPSRRSGGREGFELRAAA